MNCEVIAVGTELLLGQIIDTNSSWIGEQLALAGIDSHHQVKVGDNSQRMQAVLNQALERSDSVIMCGGLGPTQDDITRDVIAAALGVELVRRDDIVERISRVFGGRGRAMPENNLRQADVPDGAEVLPVMPGTAPGFKVEAGRQGDLCRARRALGDAADGGGVRAARSQGPGRDHRGDQEPHAAHLG